MKKRFLSLSIAALAMTISFTACKKEASNATTDKAAEASAQSDDDKQFSSEVDAVVGDASATLESSGSFTGRTDNSQTVTICDATIAVDTVSNPRTITITYNGTNCIGNRTRTGVVKISMAQGVKWKDAGASVTVTYQNLKITRVSDNKSITINGAKTFTNVTGGLLINLPTVNQMVRTVTSSGLSVTFDNGAQRTWQVARQHTYSYNNGVVLAVTGTHTEGSVSNVAEWGINRFGNAFTSATTVPVIIKQSCSGRITEGKITHTTTNVTVATTFGLDASGNATTCPGTGTYYLKLEWTGPNGNTISSILPY